MDFWSAGMYPQLSSASHSMSAGFQASNSAMPDTYLNPLRYSGPRKTAPGTLASCLLRSSIVFLRRKVGSPARLRIHHNCLLSQGFSRCIRHACSALRPR